ncbi:MAG: hypothetical protein IPF63_08520 [Bacteroidetes bacterium]|nr:hypothetical protein [Bacteroidota bacterium]
MSIIGEWKNNLVDGNATIIWDNGDKYEGEWKMKKHRLWEIYP